MKIFFYPLGLSVLLIVSLWNTTMAQERSKLVLTDINFQQGVLHYYEHFINAKEALILNPNSSAFAKDLSTYQSDVYPWVNSTGVSKIDLGFHFDNRPEIGFRVGFSGTKRKLFNNSFSTVESLPFDTLISQQTGFPIYVDSSLHKQTSMTTLGSIFNVNLAFEYRTTTNVRWDFRTGVGMLLGIVYNVTSEIDDNQDSKVTPDYIKIYSNYFENSSIEHREIHENPNLFNWGVYAPFNFGFRLGKKENYWNRIQLNVEVVPVFNFISVPGVKSIQEFTVSESFGVRYFFE